MGEIIRIYGTDITLPDQPPAHEIEDWGMPKAEQYWRRKKLPDIFKVVRRDVDGNIELTPEQEAFATKELSRFRNGFWFYKNGQPTYITGRHYYYLQYWTLENKKAPEYRDTSRRYYLYLDYWYNVYWCLGIIRGKGRRSGASSESSSNIVEHVTTTKNAKGGHVSKTSADARKMFIYRMQFGFRHLPFFLQPTIANDKDSRSELVFNVPLDKTKKNKKAQMIDEVEGLNSTLDYQPTALNSYDSERLTWAFLDEGGKFPVDVPFDQFVSVILETLVEGSEKVGFAELPSTVNEMTKKGGAAFKRVWDDATWKKPAFSDEEEGDIDPDDEATANRLVRYFCPAYDGLAGFIDKYGDSIIDEPTPEQAEYLIAKYGLKKFNGQLKLGAKKYLEKRRSKLKDKALEEEIRKYPFDEVEMFMSANADCHFNQLKITTQRRYLENNAPKIRRGTFFRKIDLKNDSTQNVDFRDDPDGYWYILAFPSEEKKNKHGYFDRQKRPLNLLDYAMGVDGYANSQGGRKYGSNACGFIYRKYDIMDPNNSGLFVAMYFGRPRTKELFHEQIMLGAEYYGCQVWYEHTADDYKGYFTERGRQAYLGVYPKNSIDPNKRDTQERYKGFPITPFAMTKQLDTMIAYVEDFCSRIYFDKLLEQLLVFEAENRTSSDAVVAAMIALVCGLEPANIPRVPAEPLIETYENQI